MKTILLALSLVLFSLYGVSQSNIDSRLLPRYSKSELQKMQKENNAEYQLLVRALEVGIDIVDFQDGKNVNWDGTLDINPNEKHTFVSLNLELKQDRNQYFKINNSNKILIVRSKNTIPYIQ